MHFLFSVTVERFFAESVADWKGFLLSLSAEFSNKLKYWRSHFFPSAKIAPGHGMSVSQTEKQSVQDSKRGK